jgi:hypothetical protein
VLVEEVVTAGICCPALVDGVAARAGDVVVTTAGLLPLLLPPLLLLARGIVVGDAPAANDDDVGPYHPVACPDIVPAELADAAVVTGICFPEIVDRVVASVGAVVVTKAGLLLMLLLLLLLLLLARGIMVGNALADKDAVGPPTIVDCMLAAPVPVVAAKAPPEALKVPESDCGTTTEETEDVADAIDNAVNVAAGRVVLAALLVAGPPDAAVLPSTCRELVETVAVAWICCPALVDRNTGAVVVTYAGLLLLLLLLARAIVVGDELLCWAADDDVGPTILAPAVVGAGELDGAILELEATGAHELADEHQATAHDPVKALSDVNTRVIDPVLDVTGLGATLPVKGPARRLNRKRSSYTVILSY